MKKSKISLQIVTLSLFLIYLAVLVWIILFKLNFSTSSIPYIRNINFIPFYYDEPVSFSLHLQEILQNVIIFIPFGVYLSMLKYDVNILIKMFLIILTTFLLETLQCVLAIGVSDITDLITNSFGGFIGIMSYNTIANMFKKKEFLDKIIIMAIAALFLPVIIIFVLIKWANA